MDYYTTFTTNDILGIVDCSTASFVWDTIPDTDAYIGVYLEIPCAVTVSPASCQNELITAEPAEFDHVWVSGWMCH